MAGDAIPDRLIANWQQQYEVRKQPSLDEVEVVHERVKGALKPLQVAHESVVASIESYIENNPWRYFNYDRNSPALKVSKPAGIKSSNRAHEEWHKVHGTPVPVVDERGAMDTSLFLQPFKLRAYDSHRRDYLTNQGTIFGWQVIMKPSDDEHSPPPPEVVASRKLVSPHGHLTSFVERSRGIVTFSTFQSRQDFKDLLGVPSLQVKSATAEDRLGFKATLQEFERIKLPTVQREIGENQAILELIARGAHALERLGAPAPTIGKLAVAQLSE